MPLMVCSHVMFTSLVKLIEEKFWYEDPFNNKTPRNQNLLLPKQPAAGAYNVSRYYVHLVMYVQLMGQ